MDPLSIAAACVGLLSGLTAVSTKIRSLTIDAKNTNKEVSALQSELDSFQRSLSVFYGSGLADDYPDHLRADLDKIIRECKYIVDEIDHLLDNIAAANFSQRVQWSFSVRDEVVRLHRHLEGHKSAITIAIAFASMSINSGIKSDTSSIRSKAARIPEIQQQLAAVFEAIQMLNSGDPSQRPQMSMAMQRFLQEAYTESLCSSILRSNSSRTSGSILASITDPFQDQVSEIGTSVTEESPKADDDYQSGTMKLHSTAALSANLDTSHSYGVPSLSTEYFGSETHRPLNLRPTSVPIQLPIAPSFIEKKTNLALTSIEKTTSQKPRFSLARIRQKRSSFPALSNNNSKPPSPSATWNSLLDLGEALSNYVSMVISTHDLILSQSAQNMYDLRSKRGLSTNNIETDIYFQDAIRLHQSGNIESATSRLKVLAESGHISSQIMYALSLRHGWGCTSDPKTAFAYLYSAAKMAVDFQHHASRNCTFPIPKALDELTLALFEIANSSRYGWGCPINAVSARSFYKVAADLGDVDAMHELAWCYLTGFGGKKEKFEAAQALRRAEWQGPKVLGNSWIWKEKYNAKPQ